MFSLNNRKNCTLIHLIYQKKLYIILTPENFFYYGYMKIPTDIIYLTFSVNNYLQNKCCMSNLYFTSCSLSNIFYYLLK